MGFSRGFLMVSRVLAVIVALSVVGLGAWSKVIIHDIDIRGIAILETVRPEPQSAEEYWHSYFSAVLGGVVRIWISIGASSFASLAGIIVLFATMLDRVRMSAALIVPIEALSMCAMATAFGTSLSFALTMDSFTAKLLNTGNSSDLSMFTMLVALSKAYVVAAGTGLFLVLVAFIVATVDACNRIRAKETCSFEPTASALGMGHGHEAIAPMEVRSRVPTMYDPRTPFQEAQQGIIEEADEEEKDLAKAGGQTARRDSALSHDSKGSKEIDMGIITGPLALMKPAEVLQTRPARPWSERSPKRRDDVIHAM